MDQENMHEPGADRTGSDRFKQDDERDKNLREANENIRKAQDDAATEDALEQNAGNKPRFDRDR